MDERYGVTVRGPDDVIACRDYPEAVALAQLLNSGFARHVETAHHEYDPLMWATPDVWGYGAERHAADLSAPSIDYATALERVRSVRQAAA